VKKAYYFNGIDDYINLSGLTEFNRESDFTISSWVWLVVRSGGGKHRPIVSKHTIDGSQNYLAEFNFQVQTNGKANFFMGNSTYYGVLFEKSWIILESQMWNHLAITFQSRVAKLYVNGLYESNDTFVGARQYGNLPIQIGRYFNDDRNYQENRGQYFQGKIDDLRLYNRALSEGEIKALFDMRSSPPPVPLAPPVLEPVPTPSQETVPVQSPSIPVPIENPGRKDCYEELSRECRPPGSENENQTSSIGIGPIIGIVGGVIGCVVFGIVGGVIVCRIIKQKRNPNSYNESGDDEMVGIIPNQTHVPMPTDSHSSSLPSMPQIEASQGSCNPIYCPPPQDTDSHSGYPEKGQPAAPLPSQSPGSSSSHHHTMPMQPKADDNAQEFEGVNPGILRKSQREAGMQALGKQSDVQKASSSTATQPANLLTKEYERILKEPLPLHPSEPALTRPENVIPKNFITPTERELGGEIMNDPVFVPTCGRNFERSYIEGWIATNHNDPLTRKPLRKNQLLPNYDLKQSIERWIRDLKKEDLETNPELLEEISSWIIRKGIQKMTNDPELLGVVIMCYDLKKNELLKV